MDVITTSVFDIFKIGPGPSSSHTIGPMTAALHFRKKISELPKELINRSTHIEVHLYGSLSATGKGHGTDRAILAGLMGQEPATCDIKQMLSFFSKEDDVYEVNIDGKLILFDYNSFCFDEIHHLFPFSNTMILQLYAKDKVILAKEYYSIGGGFISCKGEEEKRRPMPPHPYSNMTQLKELMALKNISLTDLLLENEMAITGKTKDEIFSGLYKIMDVMEQSVIKGINTEGVLPGSLNLQRKAPGLYKIATQEELFNVPDKFLIFLDCYALAAIEENAAGHLVVTAPTSGSSGIIPGLIALMKQYFKTDESLLCEGLLAAAAIGFIAKHNASISGAEVGCQGEVGVASSMGAAMLAHIDRRPIKVIENAAEIALEHQLGLTCDPIGGYVQIPCIERNAVGAVEAYNAYLLAAAGDPEKQKISFDQVVEVMLQTGKDMCLKYKETSRGGLAICDIEC